MALPDDKPPAPEISQDRVMGLQVRNISGDDIKYKSGRGDLVADRLEI